MPTNNLIAFTYKARQVTQVDFDRTLNQLLQGNTNLAVTNENDKYYTVFKDQQQYTEYTQTQSYTRNARLFRDINTMILDYVNQNITYAENFLNNNMQSFYTTFHIPKSSGGMRRIDAPQEDLKKLMRDIKDILECKMGAKPHNAAHAYREHRGTLSSLQVHQKNNSRWFLKIDLKDFFPSTDKETLLRVLPTVYPFCDCPTPVLELFVKLCLLNGGLPQGTPLSPLLTNMLMVHFDDVLSKYCFSKHLTYTRYADDLLISGGSSFNYRRVVIDIQEMLRAQGFRFTVKNEKTRYGSSAGRNWNLGLMLNKDNNITLGHKHKQRLRAGINNLLRDFTNGINWNIMDVYQLNGNLSYLKMIEPEYTDYIITELETKYNLNYKQVCKTLLSPNI